MFLCYTCVTSFNAPYLLGIKKICSYTHTHASICKLHTDTLAVDISMCQPLCVTSRWHDEWPNQKHNEMLSIRLLPHVCTRARTWLCLHVRVPRPSIRLTGDLASHWASWVWQEQIITSDPPPWRKGVWWGRGEMTLKLQLYLGNLFWPLPHTSALSASFLPIILFSLTPHLGDWFTSAINPWVQTCENWLY